MFPVVFLGYCQTTVNSVFREVLQAPRRKHRAAIEYEDRRCVIYSEAPPFGTGRKPSKRSFSLRSFSLRVLGRYPLLASTCLRRVGWARLESRQSKRLVKEDHSDRTESKSDPRR